MLGFLIYLPHMFFIPHYFFIFPFFYALIRKDRKLPSLKDRDYLFPALIVMSSTLVKLTSIKSVQTYDDLFPWFSLIICAIVIAKNLKKSDLHMFYALIVVECLIVILEYFNGVPSFWVNKQFSWEDSGLMYFTRPFGLGENSSVAAYNIFLGLLLHEILEPKKWIVGYVIQLILLCGILLTFNRTIIICCLVFFMLKNFSTIKYIAKSKWAFGIILFLIMVFFGYHYWDIILNQFTRNSGSIELTGRKMVWGRYIKFISENLFFGNGTIKYFFEFDGRTFHAHNSYLQILATSGIFVFLLYIGMIFKGVNKSNFPFVCSLAIAGLSQYIIFWGISIPDIMLFYFISKLEDIPAKKSQLFLSNNQQRVIPSC